MGASEFPPGDARCLAILQELEIKAHLGDVAYNAIQLETTEPGFTNIWDSDAEVDEQSVGFYWPHNHPERGTDFTAISFGEIAPQILGQRSMEIKRAIMGASIGEAALAETVSIMQDYWDKTEIICGSLIDKAVDLCRIHSIPLGIFFIDTVVQSNLIPSGKKTLWLYYTNVTPPRPVLERITNSVKAHLEEEKQITGQQDIE